MSVVTLKHVNSTLNVVTLASVVQRVKSLLDQQILETFHNRFTLNSEEKVFPATPPLGTRHEDLSVQSPVLV